MKIVELISDICTIGGGQSLTTGLSVELAKRHRNDVYVVSLYPESLSKNTKFLREHNINVIFLNKKPGLDFKCAMLLKKTIKAINPDIIHAHLSVCLTIWLSRIANIFPIVFTFHSIILEKQKSISEKIDYLATKSLICRHKIFPVAISSLVKENITRVFPKCNIALVNNGVDTSIFLPPADFFNRQFDFIIIGSFSDVKNQKGILFDLSKVAKSGHTFNAIFLGDGPQLQDCKNYSTENGLDSFVLFKGNVPDTEYYLSNSCFLLMKSKYEGNPMVINEAISCGTYVLSTPVGGIPDVVNDNNGKLVAEEKFSDSLVEILKNKNSFLNKTRMNINNNRKNVSIQETANRYMDVFCNIVNGRK